MDIFLPVQMASNWLVFNVFRFPSHSLLGGAINFFIYDSIKIAILLIVIMFLVSFLRSYIPPQKIKKILTGRFKFLGNILAAILGIITPFCSCSAIPLFIGLVESGVPLGVTFSYLISAPMINEVAVILLLGLFGWKIALIYVLAGLVIAIFVGFILGKMNLKHLVEDYVWKIKVQKEIEIDKKSFSLKFKEAWQETMQLFKKVFPYILLGVGIGAFIHNYAPENLLVGLAGKSNIFAVPLATIIGVPLYSNAAGILPVVSSLIEKGLPIGTALAFMMSVTALSLPEMIILRRVLKPKLLGLYIGILSVSIILVGYLFNWLI